MRKFKIVIAMLSTIIIIFYLAFSALRGDTVNRIYRKQIEFLDNTYSVTYSNDGVIKNWVLKSGKVTSTDKGYYFFWVNGKYVQSPINYTLIEQI